MIKYDTEKFIITQKNGKLYGREKDHEVLKKNKIVLVQKLGKREDLKRSVSEAFSKIKAEDIINEGDLVAIKLNLGGGINYMPTTYSDPIICEAIIKTIKNFGGKPFVCEANMRALTINDNILKKRGYWDTLRKNKCKFVNLTNYTSVKMKCLDLDVPIKFPEILLKPNVKIISFAPPKHHWECGITGNQKNMFGAISEYRKSIYHRKYDRLDKTIAAAARILSPDINILATFDLGTKNPHIPYVIKNFNRMIISRDMIRGDKVASEILTYPFQYVKYSMINTKGKDIDYILHPDSSWPKKEIIEQIKENSIDLDSVNVWRSILFLQYYMPHAFQIKIFPPIEFILSLLNR
ncbi:MAG: DUF362 domain-containing protein [Candidatus Hodarchaeota archaeon]